MYGSEDLKNSTERRIVHVPPIKSQNKPEERDFKWECWLIAWLVYLFIP